MNTKLILAAPCLALLAACGGSSTGNTGVQTLWESPRGTGAGVVRATDGTSNSVALVEDINDAGKYRTFEVVDVISETLNNDGSYSGEVVVRYADGSTANIIGVFYEKAALYANIQNDSITYVAGGEQASNMPVGSYAYSGYAESYYTYNGSDYSETGSFDMDVQFGAGTAQLTADTDESQYVNNNLTVNNNGELSGVNGTFIVYNTDGVTELERRIIDFDGTFHGSGATHVSGAAVGGATTTDDFSVMGIVGNR
jgi:hypothetical protein